MSIFSMVYGELGAKIVHLPRYNTKIARKVYNVLDTEQIADIIHDESNNYFWFEHNQYHEYVTNDVYKWLIKYLEQEGYKYLYTN
jgi:hypothetical protein